MNDIQRAIHEKKEEIKKANRELSKLQDELKKKDEPRKVKVTDIGMDFDIYDISHIRVSMNIRSNKGISIGEIRNAIESLSDKPKDEPK